MFGDSAGLAQANAAQLRLCTCGGANRVLSAVVLPLRLQCCQRDMNRPAARLFVKLLTGPQRYAVGLSMPVLMLCSMWGSAQFPQQTWICIAPILFCFAVLPLLDWVIGRDMVQDDASYAKVMIVKSAPNNHMIVDMTARGSNIAFTVFKLH